MNNLVRSRNDEAINSTRNRIYSLKVFPSLPLDIYFLFFSELIQYARQRLPEYVCGRRLYAGTDKYTKIQGPRFQKNYIFARDQKGDLHGTSFQSSPKINPMLITRLFAYNESLQHQTSFTKKDLFFVRPLSSVHLFPSDQRFETIEFLDRQNFGRYNSRSGPEKG